LQSALLHQIYPPDVAWNLPLNFSRLSPDPLNQLMRWFRGESQAHWVARRGETPIGFLSWEPMRASSDALWLAAPSEHEEAAILALLPFARTMLSGRGRALSVNYPAGHAQQAFMRSGFSNHQTLVWMTADLSDPE
jgi:hypothetical protein